MHNQTLSLIITLAVIVIALPLLYLRLRKTMGDRPLKLGNLWMRPAFIVAITFLTLTRQPPSAADTLWLVLGGVLGAGAGWYMGTMTRLDVHPEDGTLIARGSQAATMLFIGLILARMALNAGLRFEAEAWHIDPMLVADVSLVFAACLFCASAAEIFIRARRLMAPRT